MLIQNRGQILSQLIIDFESRLDNVLAKLSRRRNLKALKYVEFILCLTIRTNQPKDFLLSIK